MVVEEDHKPQHQAQQQSHQSQSQPARSSPQASYDYSSQQTAFHFPSMFSNDFGPSALLHSTPSVTNRMTYGEGVSQQYNDTFSIPRPTIELPLDDLLNTTLVSTPFPQMRASLQYGWTQSFDSGGFRSSQLVRPLLLHDAK